MCIYEALNELGNMIDVRRENKVMKKGGKTIFAVDRGFKKQMLTQNPKRPSQLTPKKRKLRIFNYLF